MKKNIQEVATENAQLQNQVAELKYQLIESIKTMGIYYDIAKYGRYEVEDNEDLVFCMNAIHEGDYREEIEKLNIFAEERGQRVYLVYEKEWGGWEIEYKNPNGIVVRLTPEQLFNSPRYNLLDDIDDLE